MADDWKRAGVNATPFVIPRARNDDYEFRVSFPAAQIQTAGNPLLAESLNSNELPTPQNAYSGGNRGHYVNPDVDKLYNDLATRYATVMIFENSGAAIGQTQYHPQ